MSRLANSTLDALPADVERPGYDRALLKYGVVHFGIGAFHRAHQAVYFDDAARRGDMRWGVRGVSLRSPDVAEQMNPQDGLYSLVVRDGASQSVRVIGAVGDVLVAPNDPVAVIEALASPDTHIVTLTITEKGYKLDPATGGLIESDADLAADLASLAVPRTAPGFLVAGLALRRERGLDPLTIISCDNLPHNGQRLRAAVLGVTRRHDPDLARWIETAIAFPQTMIDRIVPATTEDERVALAQRLGDEDRAMVKAEPFTQWVIEDWFSGPRPDFEALGVQLTATVAPWEEAKLRLLNGAHSGIAYLGGLAGIAFVDQFVARPEGRAFVEALWNEAETTLSPPPELDIAAYREALMARFANPALQHRTHQIAMDGSQKLPQRLLAPIAARLERGQSIDRLALAVAAWMRWQVGRDDAGTDFAVDDPLAEVTAGRLVGLSTPRDQVDALLSIEAIFPPSLAADGRLRDILSMHLNRLFERGALAALVL
ncbi:mannitol dehydrogenase family protein [Sphingomonas cavernae]|uniref:Mannitol dehydrogenase family protein n=1 Tax=Sphingomonas cavernae TaxID=2320861 RepID=A0A418WLB9_9SPHN|nr:mannitol dehydrogenase family protein [Sphingomonas cavernae]RJF90836.1 mannitol dehydrogenase family protein [Sphingomonas cavernae]